jgi:hypothetical protein
MPAPPAIGAKLSVENYGRRPEPPRDQDDYEDDKLVLAHSGPPLPAAYEHSIPLPIGCKGSVKVVLRNFYVLNRMPIHPSVWKQNSANFAFWGFSEVRQEFIRNSSPVASVGALINFRWG